MTDIGIRPSTCIVDLDAVRRNVAVLRGQGTAEVCAVVKADGYGHGAAGVARAALDAGATWLAVALVEEARTLRAAGITAPILLLSEPPVAAAAAVLDAAVTPFVYSLSFVAALNAAAKARSQTVAVHVKLDTGMGRVGATGTAVAALLAQLDACSWLTVDGVGTHLARTDEDDVAARTETERQLAEFGTLLQLLAEAGIKPQYVHAANTAGALRYPAARALTFPGCDTTTLLRCGIGLYGLSPSMQVDAKTHGLTPALTVRSAVSFVKHVPAGTPVSYGHRWHAPSAGYLATVPIGYADGVPRALTNRADALVNGRRLPIVGTVTMDQLMLWSGATPVAVDDAVTLLGMDSFGGSVRVEDWAYVADTITYEIASQLTARLPRQFREGSPAG